MAAAEDDDKRMRKFIVSLFRQSDDVGHLTMKFLRTKFLEELGRDSLEPDRKQRFREIVHELFLSFSPKKQDSQCKDKMVSSPKKQSRIRRVSSDEDETGSDTKDQDESANEVQNSDTDEEQSPMKKKRRIAAASDESSEEVDKNSNYKHNSHHNGMKVLKSIKSREPDTKSKTFNEKTVREEKIKSELKKSAKEESIASSGEESVPCNIARSKRKEFNRSSSEESDHEMPQSSKLRHRCDKSEVRLDKSKPKRKALAKKSARKEYNSEKSERNENKRKPYREKSIQDSGDESDGSLIFDDKNKQKGKISDGSSDEDYMYSVEGLKDSDKLKVRGDSDNRRKHKEKVLPKANTKVSDDSSDEDYPVARLKAPQESEKREVGENSDFKLSLSKDSSSDNATSAESDDSSGDEMSKAPSKGKKESESFSKEEKEKKKLKNSKKAKKRKRIKSSEKARRPSVEAEDSGKLRNLKKYVRACGMHVQKYAALFEGCRSMAARERRLDSYIREETEIEGRITLEKCKKARAAREEAKELAELDTTNIITYDSGRRPRRACQSWYSDSVPKRTPTPPVSETDDKKIFSRLKGIVDSDSESGDAKETDERAQNGAGQESSGEEMGIDPKRKQRVLASISEDED